MYRVEEVLAAGLTFGMVVTPPLGYADSLYPSEETVEAFYREVEGEEGLVAVHCAHGINRTGYLICRYMVDRLGLQPEEAIARFNLARGFPLQRESLLEHLRSRGWRQGAKEVKVKMVEEEGVVRDEE